MKLTVIILYLVLQSELFGGVGGQTPSEFPYAQKDNRKQMVLLSWSVGKDYAFALVPVEYYPGKLLQNNRSELSALTLAKLKAMISKLPPDVVISWRDYLALKIDYPPQSIIQQVKKSTSARGIDLQIIPGIYD